jgi:D-beta-D-heptose 7-phosphate kinase/D-beta-D-heptose 1-phosphate adenosyltransferase
MNEIKKILEKFKSRNLLVVGDVGVDKYTIGKVSRISPEAPIPIVEVQNIQLKLGLASNVADNITALGAHAVLVGVIGRDYHAEELKGLMKKANLDPQYLIKDSFRKTIVKERVVAEAQQVVRIDHETPTKVEPKILRKAWLNIEKIMNQVDGVIIEDYAKGFIDASLCKQIIASAEEKSIPVFVDPNARTPISTYYGCTVITPNTNEAESLSGIRIHDTESLYQAGMKILEDTNAKIVVITRGKDGMAIFEKNKPEPALIPTFAREVYDVSGAGDTAIATLALAYTSGAEIMDSAMLANIAAGIVVGKRGTATTSIKEILQTISILERLSKKNKK